MDEPKPQCALNTLRVMFSTTMKSQEIEVSTFSNYQILIYNIQEGFRELKKIETLCLDVNFMSRPEYRHLSHN